MTKDEEEPKSERLTELLRGRYHVPPAFDLEKRWPAVRAAAGRPILRWTRSPAFRMAMAAVLVLAVGTAVVARRRGSDMGPLAVELAFAEPIERLTRKIERIRDQVSPETLAGLDAVRADTERAVREMRRAIRARPDREAELVAEIEDLLRSQRETLAFVLSLSAPSR
ncbi:MAG: hypothetical protein HOP28_08005 [Gemmatimonadales bacterium]|nr:hypothetical protein [Gemmatimonadales bacterium]